MKKNYDLASRIKHKETEYRIFNLLNKVVPYLNLNKNIQTNSAYFYKKITKEEEKILNNLALIAFCVFYAVRQEYHNAPITISEISAVFQNFGHRVTPRLILRNGVNYKHHLNNTSTPHKSEDYLIRLVNQLIRHEDLPNRLLFKGVSWDKTKLIGFVSALQIEVQISQGMLLFGIFFLMLIIIPSILNINYGFKKDSIIKKNLKIPKDRKEYYKNLKELRNKISQSI
ncbi:MAG: hypothetical protein K940chlam5_00746 [Candidatus Anoxychlamydiales bacterium]|nr:hypothetical protein [Candidatus Anoxychlamydiales bacterium]